MRQDGFKLSSKKTAILSFSLAILITLSAVLTFNAAEALYATDKFADGEGTVDNPYIISNLADLENFRDYVEDTDNNYGQGKHFKLNNDIDMLSEYGSGGQSWNPIGNYSHGFAGTLGGAGHAIKNLYIEDGTMNGLFVQIDTSGIVKNLIVSGTITGGSNSGAITYYNNGKIENCHSKCEISGAHQTAGGIAGFNSNGGIIQNCWNSGSVTATGFSGGIAGQNSESSTIENCYNTADIKSTGTNSNSSGAGGIAGRNTDTVSTQIGGTIKNCYNIGNVSGSNTNVHSIVGNNGNSSSVGKVENCYYLDSLSKDENATSKTADEFKSGEVAHLLHEKTENQVWGQSLGTDDYPILSADADKKVLKVSFMYKNPSEGTGGYTEYAARYTNPNGTVTLPNNIIEESGTSYIINGWSTDESGTTADFDSTNKITYDIEVYAIIKTMRFKDEYIYSGETRYYGDVNGDGEYNVIDAYIIRKIIDAKNNLESIGLNDGKKSIEYQLADIVYDSSVIGGESVVDQDDLDFINNYIVGNIKINEN